MKPVSGSVAGLLTAILALAVLFACTDSGGSDGECTADADSATFEVSSAAPTTLVMNGTIDCTTQQKLESALASQTIDTIEMQIVGGSVDDDANIAMSRALAGRGLDITVSEGGFIASGGVDFFLAGATRTIGNNSTVAVHSWSSGDGREGLEVYNADPSAAEHQVYIGFYSQFVTGLRDGRPSNAITDAATDFYVYTLEVAPSSGLHCMTAEELVDWGIVTNTTNPSDLNPTVMGGAQPDSASCTH